MSSYDPPTGPVPGPGAPLQPGLQEQPAEGDTGPRARVGTVVWGLVVLALASLIIITGLGLVTLDGTHVLIGLMIGAGTALVIGGLVSARKRDNEPTKGKS